ncbi:MAG: Uma2 family endonuclease [Rhodothermales bacterium]
MQTTTPTSDYELERGKPLPSLNHSITQALLVGAFLRYRAQYTVASELSLELEGQRFTPDVCLYPKLQTDPMQDQIRMTEPPILTVEIESPTQSTQDLVDKIRLMLGLGVRSAWLVQPTLQTVTVFHPGTKPKTFTQGQIQDDATDVEVSVEEVFASS